MATTGGQQFQQISSTVKSAVKNAMKKTRTKIAQLNKQMGSADKNADLQKLGDLLMANVHRCEPGMASIEVEDWDTGEKVVIQLDPQKSAPQVAEALYKRSGCVIRLSKQHTSRLAFVGHNLDASTVRYHPVPVRLSFSQAAWPCSD